MRMIVIDTIEEHWATFVQRAMDSGYTEAEAEAYMDKLKAEEDVS